MPKTEMLINYVPGEESRIAIVRDGKLEEFYQERASAESHVGNIYQGKVMNVEPSIQAAFVDFGLERNGFLHISDVHPKYFPGKDREEFEQVGSKTPHRERPPIQKCLRRGDVVLVQVLKEGIGTKGPTLTSYLSIPGRFLVMMPDMQRTGVSRKVEDDEARREMRKILDELNPPKDFGFIIRTAGIGQTKTELKRDLSYLQRLWKNLERSRKGLRGPGELYTESDLIIRTIRDVFTSDIDRIVVDDVTAARRAHDFLAVASPRSRSKVVCYHGPVPLYHRFDIESQIESIHARTVSLPSGGSLVIDQTEALVAIDVNSGKSRDARDAESNAYNTNLEAVDEICRQLRLRDMGGVVVNDLIDMRSPKHRKAVEARMRDNLKRDRARTRLGSISQFGILEMTRQRMRGSLKSSLYTHCAACAGTGHVKTAESVVLDVMRRMALAMHHKNVARIELTISPDVAFQLLNRKRHALVELEDRFGKGVMVRVGGSTLDFVEITAFDARGGAVEPSAFDTEPGDESADDFVEMTGQPTDLELEDESLDADTRDETLDDEDTADEGDGDDARENAAASSTDDGHASTRSEIEEGEGDGKRRRRRRRGGRRRRRKGGDHGDNGGINGESHAGDSEHVEDVLHDDTPLDPAQVSEPLATDGSEHREASGKPARPVEPEDHSDAAEDAAEVSGLAADATAERETDGGEGVRKRRRRRRRRGRGANRDGDANGSGNGHEIDAAGAPDTAASHSNGHNSSSAEARLPQPEIRPPQTSEKPPAPKPVDREPAPINAPPRAPRPVSSGYKNRSVAKPSRDDPNPGNVRKPGDDA